MQLFGIIWRQINLREIFAALPVYPISDLERVRKTAVNYFSILYHRVTRKETQAQRLEYITIKNVDLLTPSRIIFRRVRNTNLGTDVKAGKNQNSV
jgi:23S rRNA maturation mini-RNase III